MTQFITRRQRSDITVGLDLGKHSSHALVVDRKGEILFDGKVATSRDSFGTFFTQWVAAEVVFEVGPQSPWVNALLLGLGHEALAVNARELPEIYRTKKKSDRIDARKLVELAWSGRELPLVQLRNLKQQADLAVIRSRVVLVDERTKLVNHVRSTCAAHGVRLPQCDAAYFHKKVKELIPESLEPALGPLFSQLESLAEAIKSYDKKIDSLSQEEYPQTQRLASAHGVGNLTALAFILTLHDCRRFKSSRAAGAYIGLVPRLDQTSGSNPQLRITKAGDPYLRKLLVTAAHCILRANAPDSEIRRHGLRICPPDSKNKGAKKRALIAVARKLAVVLHHLWIEDEDFVPFPNGPDPQTQAMVAG